MGMMRECPLYLRSFITNRTDTNPSVQVFSLSETELIWAFGTGEPIYKIMMLWCFRLFLIFLNIPEVTINFGPDEAIDEVARRRFFGED
jgi:hypothetical protein